VVIRREDTRESLEEKVRTATILGTFQSTLTEFKYLSREWKKNCDEERLLGVSLTGIMDNPLTNGSKKGLDLMNDAAKAGFIHIGDKLKIEDIDDFQPHQVNKKKAVYARHQGMIKAGSPTIATDGLRIKELSKLNSNEFNEKEELGIGSRIKKI